MNTNCIGNFHFKYLGMEEGYLGKKSSGFFIMAWQVKFECLLYFSLQTHALFIRSSLEMLPKFACQNTVLCQIPVLTFVSDSVELLGNTDQLWISESGRIQDVLMGEESVVRCIGCMQQNSIGGQVPRVACYSFGTHIFNFKFK